MTSKGTPTLADDEASLAAFATALADAVEAVVPSWFARMVETHAPELTVDDTVAQHLAAGSIEAVATLRALLDRDIADQAVGPLEVLRRSIAIPTSVLAAAEIEPVERDEFSRTNFPDDIYALTPGSFRDIDETLHEPGLMWGAAKAHVHLRRRREAESAVAAPVVVALSADLMDRSKISGAFPDAALVRSVPKLVEATQGASLILVDLARVEDLGELTDLPARVVGFGSHVNEELLASAREAGIETMPRSVFFRRLENRDF